MLALPLAFPDCVAELVGAGVAVRTEAAIGVIVAAFDGVGETQALPIAFAVAVAVAFFVGGGVGEMVALACGICGACGVGARVALLLEFA